MKGEAIETKSPQRMAEKGNIGVLRNKEIRFAKEKLLITS
jgi:hypothetical protein